MTTYKVVRRINKKLYSACIIEPVLRVEYIPGVLCRALQGTPIFAFSGLERAQEMARLQATITPHTYEVWQCEGKPTDISVDEVLLFVDSWKVVKEFWRSGSAQGHYKCNVMPDTVFLSEIVLERKIS